MKKLVLSSAMLLMVGPALAADLPVPYYAPPPPAFWTGPFLGGAVGYEFGTAGNQVPGKDLFCADAFCPTPIVTSAFNIPGSTSNGGLFAGGAQLGYNLQFDPNFVVGGVVDIIGLNHSASTSGTKTIGPIENLDEVTTYSDSFNSDWLSTVRLKVGPAFDNLWIYATGGLAIGDLRSSSSTTTTWIWAGTPPGPGTYPAVVAYGSGSSSSPALGYAVGAGAEYKITPNWSVFGEYLYYSLSDPYTVTVNPQNSGLTGIYTSSSYRVNSRLDGNLVKVGFNYTFWGY